MISHGKNVKVFCANANRPFAEGVCRKLWLPLGDCTVTTFADGEVSLTINESVRGSDVFLVQSTALPPAASPPSSRISAMPARTARPRAATPSPQSSSPI